MRCVADSKSLASVSLLCLVIVCPPLSVDTMSLSVSSDPTLAKLSHEAKGWSEPAVALMVVYSCALKLFSLRPALEFPEQIDRCLRCCVGDAVLVVYPHSLSRARKRSGHVANFELDVSNAFVHLGV